MLALIIVTIFASVALLSGLLLYPLLSRQDSVRERVAKLMPQQEEELTLIPTPKKWQTVLAEMGTKLKSKPTDLRKYRESLTAAGFKKEAVYALLGAKLVLAVVLPAAYLLLIALPQGILMDSTSLMLTALSAIAGYLLPSLWISRRGALRKVEIFHALPDVLDLLTVCVEAGLSLDAALIKTTENFQQQKCPLISELNTVILEVRAGRARSEALKGLAERTTVDDIKALVSMLIQTEKFGTSLGKTLRTYSDSLRTKRRQIAEEQAAKTAVKMLFPLTFCVFPALMVVMLVPAFFQMFHMFK
jgi:tight adherence protein C